MAGRQYAVPGTGRNGKLCTAWRKTKYHNGSLGRDRLLCPGMLSISVRKERYSYDILKETGEFVVNLVTKDLVFATDYCGVKSGRDTDKFKEMKLTPLPSQHISAPGIAESPLNLECRVKQVVELGSHDMFIAEIVGVTVDDRYMDAKGTFHLNDAKLVSYSHGTYFELGEKIGTFGYSVRKDSAKAGTKKKKESAKTSGRTGNRSGKLSEAAKHTRRRNAK